MESLKAYWRKNPLLVVLVAVAVTAGPLCTCCVGTVLFINQRTEANKPRHPFGFTDEQVKQAEQATDRLRKENDLKERFLKVAEEADARGDREAAAKAMRDLDEELKKLKTQ